jgi:hypothetical protein
MANALAIAVTRQLIQYSRNFGRELIRPGLIRLLENVAPELVLRENLPFTGLDRGIVVRRNMVALGKTDSRHQGKKDNQN